MNVTISIPASLTRFLDCLKPQSRRDLYSVGANALRIRIASYIRAQVPSRHNSAERLGGRPTGHLEKGASRITSSSTTESGTVSIPIAGISRAFHDVVLTPKKSSALTIPTDAASYGHRVRELERMGWDIFRPKGEDYLLGVHNKGDAPTCLYLLRKQVRQNQDRTLLPSDAEMGSAVSQAMLTYIRNSIRKAG